MAAMSAANAASAAPAARTSLATVREAGFQLAQVNIGRIKGPMDGDVMADFAAALEPINALADRSPGFVWRLQTEDGDATSIRPYPDDRMIVNMSVWESIDALWKYVYDSDHLTYMRRRREWFERMEMHMALWWLPAGHRPSVEEAKERLELLRAEGPTPEAFTFKRRFPPEDSLSGTSRARLSG
jgi:hypothetical protein